MEPKPQVTIFCAHRRMPVVVAWILFSAAATVGPLTERAQAANVPCPLQPVAFPGDSMAKALGLPSSTAGGLPLTSSQASFEGPRFDPRFGKEVVTPVFRLEFNASALASKWASQLEHSIHHEGCSSRRAHTFRWDTPAGNWRGDFHIKHVERACYWFFGDQKTDKATIEIDAWQSLSPRISADSRTFEFVPAGGATDNVPDWLRGALKVLGNLLALEPISSLLLHLDEEIFAALKTERESLEMFANFQSPVGPQSIKDATTFRGLTLDLGFRRVWFENRGSGTLMISAELATGDANPLSIGQACLLRASLEQQQFQHERIGDGVDHVVSKGESAWGIANSFYGDGRYHLMLLETNGINDRQADRLVPGQALRVRPLRQIMGEDSGTLVMYGESLWSISCGDSNPELFASLVAANRERILDPNRIYPIQLIALPAGVSAREVRDACK